MLNSFVHLFRTRWYITDVMNSQVDDVIGASGSDIVTFNVGGVRFETFW